MNEYRKKTGSVTVFVCIFFVTLVSVILAFTRVCRETAVSGAAESLGSLWADSILGEYDLNLQRRYNLFGFYGYTKAVTDKLDFYAKPSFADKAYIDYAGSTCSLYDYALVNREIFAAQVRKAGLLAFTEKFQKPVAEIKKIDGEFQGENLFTALPSSGSEKSFSVSAAVDALKTGGMVEKGTDAYAQVQYIFGYFKDRSDDRQLGSTYLNSEVEYILCGKKSDAANESRMRNKIIAVREPLNFLYLQKDSTKRAAALAAAQLLTPGPAAVLTEKAILAAWAFAESVNDYKLLISGHRVQTVKSAQSWAVDLDSVLANKEDDCIFTGVELGQDYEDYLKIFLYAMDEGVRLLRIMDLIQINMRYLYYDGFRLREYNGGVSFTLTVNGREHVVEKTYEKRQLSG